ncbi:hypothetical protein DTL70_21890 [Streptomyces diacarni]|uniref:Uncharacterized protein n=1 Tax=Streptomyces diacarni TaxID=2800381 RepID=A0A367EMV1_9ACTN|nr:hypothetical protein DTL70_21890 [Streptomyces diacarni]
MSASGAGRACPVRPPRPRPLPRLRRPRGAGGRRGTALPPTVRRPLARVRPPGRGAPCGAGGPRPG